MSCERLLKVGERACWSVAEIRELKRDPKVFFFESSDRVLKIVAFLAGHPELISLDLMLRSLEPEVLKELTDLACLIARNPHREFYGLTGSAPGCFFHRSMVEHLEGDLAADELLL